MSVQYMQAVEHEIELPLVRGTKTCPQCKKVFDWLGEQWVYKSKHHGKTRYYCSWSCWRAADKKK